MRKILSLFLCFMIIFSLSFSVFAANTTTQPKSSNKTEEEVAQNLIGIARTVPSSDVKMFDGNNADYDLGFWSVTPTKRTTVFTYTNPNEGRAADGSGYMLRLIVSAYYFDKDTNKWCHDESDEYYVTKRAAYVPVYGDNAVDREDKSVMLFGGESVSFVLPYGLKDEYDEYTVFKVEEWLDYESEEYTNNLIFESNCYGSLELLEAEDEHYSQFIKALRYASPWAQDIIHEAAAYRLIPERQKNNFQSNIMRWEFADLIVAYVEKATVKEITYSESNAFIDCDDYAVIKAREANIVEGVGENKFAPNRLATREQIAAMIQRALVYVAREKDAIQGDDYYMKQITVEDNMLEKFADKNDISEYAVEPINRLVGLNVIYGTTDTTISPKDYCTKEQAIAMIYRCFKNF